MTDVFVEHSSSVVGSEHVDLHDESGGSPGASTASLGTPVDRGAKPQPTASTMQTHQRKIRSYYVASAPSVSTAIPMMAMPLSTYTVVPVMPLASGLHRNAAVVPTSRAVIASGSGELRFA